MTFKVPGQRCTRHRHTVARSRMQSHALAVTEKLLSPYLRNSLEVRDENCVVRSPHEHLLLAR